MENVHVQHDKIKARGATYVRFFPTDWRSGCIGLSLEQEGLYIRVCAFIYETGQRLCHDDKRAAKLMGVHPNAYRKIRDQLVTLGKVVSTDLGWTVMRVERELDATHAALAPARRAHGTQPKNGSVAVQQNTDTLPDTLGDTPLDTPPDTLLDTPPNRSKNINEINSPLIEPIANSQEPRTRESSSLVQMVALNGDDEHEFDFSNLRKDQRAALLGFIGRNGKGEPQKQLADLLTANGASQVLNALAAVQTKMAIQPVGDPMAYFAKCCRSDIGPQTAKPGESPAKALMARLAQRDTEGARL